MAVVLSGCGVYDGTEIQEASAALVALSREGCHVQCYAPDQNQAHVIDHSKGLETSGERNCLAEAARIARGDIRVRISSLTFLFLSLTLFLSIATFRSPG